MSFNLPNGAVMDIAQAYDPVISFTAISNAHPPVASSTGHGLQEGAIVVVESGWTRLNGRVAKVGAADGDSFVLQGLDTIRSVIYPIGAGVGTVTAVSAWVPISQITEVATQGGEQQFATVGFLEDDEDRQLPTTKSAASMTITVADDPSMAYVAVCEAADEMKRTRAVRLTLPNGSIIYYNAYVSIASTPNLSRNDVMTRTITLSLAARPTRYQA